MKVYSTPSSYRAEVYATPVSPDDVEVDVKATRITLREALDLQHGDCCAALEAAALEAAASVAPSVFESYGPGELLCVDSEAYAVRLASGEMAWAEEVHVGTMEECAAALAEDDEREVTLTHKPSVWARMTHEEILAQAGVTGEHRLRARLWARLAADLGSGEAPGALSRPGVGSGEAPGALSRPGDEGYAVVALTATDSALGLPLFAWAPYKVGDDATLARRYLHS